MAHRRRAHEEGVWVREAAAAYAAKHARDGGSARDGGWAKDGETEVAS